VLFAAGLQVADQAMEHVHANEVILTFGHSNTTFHFLREVAKRDRKFEVVIAEGAPALQGHTMAQELAKAGISTTVISDAAIFGMMSRVNKVIVGCHGIPPKSQPSQHCRWWRVSAPNKRAANSFLLLDSAVLANGGILAPTGMHMVATAAKHHNVPFVVCTGMYKLAPVFPHDQYSFNELRCPAEVAGPSVPHNAAVLNPSSDYVPPDMVSIFITNAGGHNPSYIYRLMADNYCMEDRASL
jgi:translation initiation factor eIF-2B subunit beta